MFDFDFSSFAVEDSKGDVSETDDELPKVDNLIPFDAERLNSRAESQAQDETNQSIDDILRELAQSGAQQDQAPKQGRAASVLNIETPDLGFDLTSSVQADGETLDTEDMESLLDEENDEYAPLTDMDQLETKLDLAKAYADMDDKQSALDMLKDVLEMGSEQQREEARALMDKLSAQEVSLAPKSVVAPLRRT
jgi:pilus assembly protein FimV